MTFPCLNISLGELQKASGREISGQWGTSVEVKHACSSSVYSGCSSERLSYRLWFSMACGNLFPHDLTCLKVLIGKFRSFTVLWASLTNHFCISIWAFSVRSYTCLKKQHGRYLATFINWHKYLLGHAYLQPKILVHFSWMLLLSIRWHLFIQMKGRISGKSNLASSGIYHLKWPTLQSGVHTLVPCHSAEYRLAVRFLS